MITVVLLGTLDTKEAEYAWLRDRIRAQGVEAIVIDTGLFSDSGIGDVPVRDVIEAAGADLEALRAGRDRGETMQVMGRGAAQIVRRLYDEGFVDGVLTVGGSGGSSIAATVMQSLPVGFPKLLVTTMASGDVSPYVGDVDTTLMYPVVEGINAVSEMVLDNACGAIAGMAKAYAARRGGVERGCSRT